MMKRIVLLIIAGGLLTLAFAPFRIYPIAFFSPAVLLYYWLKSTPRQAFIEGLTFGFSFFAFSTSWVFISIYRFGNAPMLVAGFITALMVLILALYPATQGYFLKYFFNSEKLLWFCLGYFPATWVIWEWLRGWIFTGFPWVLLGYSQTDGILSGLAPMIGVYGLSFVIAFISGAIIVIGNQFISQAARLAIIGVILILALISSWGNRHHWTVAAPTPLQVSLVQGNIPQYLKWDYSSLIHTLDTYQQLTDDHWQSSLIIWPETAIPIYPQQIPGFIESFANAAKQHRSVIISGAPLYDEKTKNSYNGMIMFGQYSGEYRKQRLVPFGEYIPLSFIFKHLMFYQFPQSSFSAGAKNQPPFQFGKYEIAPFICYEIAYPSFALDVIEGTQLIVNVTDDGWFGDSIAPDQQLQMAEMRAKETGRYLLSSTNTGITAIIGPKGQIESVLPRDKAAVLTSKITMQKGRTPLMIFHYFPIFILSGLICCIGIFLSRQKKS